MTAQTTPRAARARGRGTTVPRRLHALEERSTKRDTSVARAKTRARIPGFNADATPC